MKNPSSAHAAAARSASAHQPLVYILIATAIAGCASDPATTASAGSANASQTASTTAATAKPANAGSVAAQNLSSGANARQAGALDAKKAAPPHQDPASPLAKRSVFFDYDKFVVKTNFLPPLKAHAEYLSKNSALKMQIEGSADERGSREYNMALGQKRAEAVKRSLTAYGAPADRIETISFGEEKPKATGHDEAAWAENRRADALYKGEF